MYSRSFMSHVFIHSSSQGKVALQAFVLQCPCVLESKSKECNKNFKKRIGEVRPERSFDQFQHRKSPLARCCGNSEAEIYSDNFAYYCALTLDLRKIHKQ
jgi:hypothetical protein